MATRSEAVAGKAVVSRPKRRLPLIAWWRKLYGWLYVVPQAMSARDQELAHRILKY